MAGKSTIGGRKTAKDRNLPTVRKQDDVVACLVSDIHLSHKPPLARSCEEDWYSVQKRYLDQLKEISKNNNALGKRFLTTEIPVICGGDIFDKAICPPELINFALENLPHMYAVPGQHDLVNHSLADIKKSAFWTLAEASVITPIHLMNHDIDMITCAEIDNIRLHGFPWGYEPESLENPHDMLLEVAVVHGYIWNRQTGGYPGAKAEENITERKKNLKGYDVVLFGDNHKTLFDEKEGIFNPGSFMRRKQDERDHRPCVGLLHASGKITIEYLDTSEDKFLDAEDIVKTMNSIGIETFVEELQHLGKEAFDFAEVVSQVLSQRRVPAEVKAIIERALES